MQAGKARFTLRFTTRSGVETRFTYRMAASDDGRVFFVSLLTGSDNESSYSYMGIVNERGFRRTAKSRISEDALGHRAFARAWSCLSAGTLPDTLEIWHEGRCGRCGRTLTVPESIEAGIGPECAGRLGGDARSPKLRGMGTRAGRAKHKADVQTYNETVMSFRPKRKMIAEGDLPEDSVDDLYR
jgi:hypothetical protein